MRATEGEISGSVQEKKKTFWNLPLNMHYVMQFKDESVIK